MSVRLGLLAVVAVVLALAAAVAVAAPGDVDTSFDGDGRQTVDHGGSDGAAAVLVQPDGKIVLAGTGTAAEDFIVSRLNPNGSLDTSFDVDGRNYVDLGGVDRGFGAALQADGKIVVAGSTSVAVPGGRSESNVAVMRFDADASLDNSFDPAGFDGPGVKVFDYDYLDGAEDVLIQPDGKIVVAGRGGPGAHLAVTRLNPDGGFDTSFDTDGTIGIDFGSLLEGGRAAALQADGKIVVVGDTYTDDDANNVAVTRLNANGSLDTSFDPGGDDGAGKKIINYGGNDRAYDVLVQPDGKVVLVAEGYAGGDFVVTRLNPDGSPDLGFAFDGTSEIDFGPGDAALAAALQANGKIVVAGLTQAAGEADDPALARLQPGGALDTTFSSDGKQTLPTPGRAGADGVALQADGRIVLGGAADFNMLAARFDGDPATAGGGPAGVPGGGGGGGGGDRRRSVPRCAGKRATIVGTPRRDRLRGTRRSDVIVSLAGNDRIKGGKGNDRICAGTGNDSAAGGAGNDRLYGQGGKDKVSGGGGKDALNGGGGRDDCNGGPGNDRGRCEREKRI